MSTHVHIYICVHTYMYISVYTYVYQCFYSYAGARAAAVFPAGPRTMGGGPARPRIKNTQKETAEYQFSKNCKKTTPAMTQEVLPSILSRNLKIFSQNEEKRVE